MFLPIHRAHFVRAWLAHALCMTLALHAPASRAQSAAASKPDTTQTSASATITTTNSKPPAQASSTPLRYCSAFANYQRLNQQAVSPWRSSNDAVLQAGGWRELAMHAHRSMPDAADKTNDKVSECPPGVAGATVEAKP
ncbi:MAG: hypothetical protein RL748_623 [Pseudomonadota bacterium]